MKVSVLVPVCNGETFLAECLESVLAQDYADMEILIADDASTDGSAALMKRYAARDSRIRWWKNPNKLGLAQNFNCCLRAAKGEYIKYVHQDDKLISPLAIQSLAGMLDHHPEVSLVSSMSQVLDERSRVVELRKCFEPGVMEGRQAIVQCLERLSNRIGEPSVVMFRRGPAARGFNEQFCHWLDLDLWFHLLAQAQFAYLAEPLSAFRRHARQQSEINHHSGATSVESMALFKQWFERLGLQQSKWNQALFAQIRALRRSHGAEAEYSRNEMMRALGRDRYFLLWCRHKIMRPFQKIHKQASHIAGRFKTEQALDTGGRTGGPIEKDRPARKRILVIDARPLTPEQDSGSLRMFHLLQILRQMEMEVTFVTDNLQCNSWTGKLESLGIKNLYRPRINDLTGFLKLHSAAYDDVVLSRLTVAEKHIDLIKKHAPETRIFFDTVDLHYLRMDREAQTKADGVLKRLAAECKKSELAVARKAHTTLVVSPVEQQILRKECPQIRIEVVSNIHEIPARGGGFPDRRGLLFIGGFDHSPNVDAVLFFVRNIFPLVEKALPDVRFHVIGSNIPAEIGSLANLKILVHGFVPDAGPFFNACRLSVAPLRFGAGIKGKINQSHAYGVPVVATSVAVEGMQLEHGESVMVADTPKKFAEAIVSVYTNESLWNRLSQRGTKNLEEHFSFDSARAGLESLFGPDPKTAGHWTPVSSAVTRPGDLIP